MEKDIVIAVDAMGGDNYPESQVVGALRALEKYPDISIVLLGKTSVIETEMRKETVVIPYEKYYKRIRIVEAPEVVAMDIKDPSAVLHMPQSSIFIGAGMQKNGTADAFVSAGNTGSVMAASLIKTGRSSGIKRPAIATVIPTKNGPCVNLDVGANASNIPFHLIQFAIMGSVYANKICGVTNPKVGLMSLGEEASKGNDLIKVTNQNLEILQQNGFINFIGNIQGNDMFAGTADVIVMDGFTGNVLLKMAESLMPTLKDAIKKNLQNSSFVRKAMVGLSEILLRPIITSIKQEFDYQRYGGAPLLGVNGVVIIAHGKSSALAMMHAIRMARLSVHQKMVAKISTAIDNVPMNLLKL